MVFRNYPRATLHISVIQPRPKAHHHPFPNSAGCSPPSLRRGRAPIQIQVSIGRSSASVPYPLGVLIVPVPIPPSSIGDPSRTGFDPFCVWLLGSLDCFGGLIVLLCSVEYFLCCEPWNPNISSCDRCSLSLLPICLLCGVVLIIPVWFCYFVGWSSSAPGFSSSDGCSDVRRSWCAYVSSC